MTAKPGDDYVWIYMDGHSNEIWTNNQVPPNWGDTANTQISLTTSIPREGIHVADWDGDGKCDVLVQDQATGALTLWHNDYVEDSRGQGQVTFTNKGVVTNDQCSQGWGVGIFDRGMLLADIE